MDGRGSASLCSIDYLVYVEIVTTRSIPYPDGFIGNSDMPGILVWCFIKGHGIVVQFLDRPDNSKGYFTPVGN